MRRYDLAQLNVGRLVAPTDDPEVAGFMDELDRTNALADASEGFLWRFQTEDGNATAERPFDDETMLVNFSTWTSVEALADYVYRSAHTALLRRRREWFERLDEITSVLWWVPAGHHPTVTEAIGRLDLLRRQGPTPVAFTFRQRFEPGASAPSEADDRDTCPA